ncbi:MAG: biliverdin-producing heme oxygenase [Pseudomonadota bacterium]
MAIEVPVLSYSEPSENLRQTLRKATADAHDRLDSTMRAVAGWSTISDYTRFLSLQYAARKPVEEWLEAHAPADLCPPAQSPMIAADLTDLGCALPTDDLTFDPPSFNPSEPERGHSAILGAAWVLAGSSLGNRAILGEITRLAEREGWPSWPSRFLGDPHMLDFWKRLRAKIENAAEIDTVLMAIQSADLVFEHFITHAQSADVTV